MPSFGGYQLNVTSQTLPHLDAPWTTIEVADKSFKFQRDTNKSKVFAISGYIQLSNWASTLAEAEGLNTALNTTPSGVFTDGWGYSYSCLVDSFEISYVPAVNKVNFSMTLRMVE